MFATIHSFHLLHELIFYIYKHRWLSTRFIFPHESLRNTVLSCTNFFITLFWYTSSFITIPLMKTLPSPLISPSALRKLTHYPLPSTISLLLVSFILWHLWIIKFWLWFHFINPSTNQDQFIPEEIIGFDVNLCLMDVLKTGCLVIKMYSIEVNLYSSHFGQLL